MSYLSRRMREIRQEEERRSGSWVMEVDYGFPMHEPLSGIYPRPMRIVDPGMQRLQDLAFERYEETLLARNPHMREHINFRGRGA